MTGLILLTEAKYGAGIYVNIDAIDTFERVPALVPSRASDKTFVQLRCGNPIYVTETPEVIIDLITTVLEESS